MPNGEQLRQLRRFRSLTHSSWILPCELLDAPDSEHLEVPQHRRPDRDQVAEVPGLGRLTPVKGGFLVGEKFQGEDPPWSIAAGPRGDLRGCDRPSWAAFAVLLAFSVSNGNPG